MTDLEDIDKALDIIKKADELFKTEKAEKLVEKPADPVPPNDVLELSVKELRRLYDKLCRDFDRARNKALALLGASFAFLSFLYSGGNLFIPPQTYGRIFYAIGIAGMLFALFYLISAFRPNQWPVPTEFKEHRNLAERYKNKNEFLNYVKNEYLATFDEALPLHEKKVNQISASINSLLIGVTILLLIKYFGG